MEQQPQEQAAPAAPQQQQAGPGPITQLVTEIHTQLAKLVAIVGQGNANEDAKQAFAAILQAFEGAVDQLSGPRAAQQNSIGPSEAGGADVKPAM